MIKGVYDVKAVVATKDKSIAIVQKNYVLCDMVKPKLRWNTVVYVILTYMLKMRISGMLLASL